MVAHSGGGAITALALNQLSNDGYRRVIHDHVRMLSMAGFAAAQDYVDAGVDPSNVLYLGEKADAVAVTGSTYVNPHHAAKGVETVVSRLRDPSIDFSLGSPHDVNNIIPDNQARPGGTLLA